MRVDNYCACSCECPNTSNEPAIAKPLFHKGDLTQRKHSSVYPRVYHKRLRTDNLLNIYGADVVDRSMGNVSEIVVAPLNANQEELINFDRKYIYNEEEY